MQKIGSLTSTATPQGEFTDGVVAQGIVPTFLLADWFNTIQRELVKVVEGAGLTLNPADDTQVWQAIKRIASGYIDIATSDDINDGTAGKLVDAEGLVKYMSDRFAIIYPNGGSEASPANITINQRYVMDNPFPGRYVACQVELYYNNIWGIVAFTQSFATNPQTGVGAICGQVSDSIVIQSGSGALIGSSAGTGNLFNSTTAGVTTAPCRVKVWRID